MPTKRKTIIGCIALLFVGWALLNESSLDLLWIGNAFAEESASEVTATALTSILTVIITFLNFFIYMILHLLTILLDPQFILDLNNTIKTDGGELVLLVVWRVARDITNIIFAFMLIIGAVVTVVFAKGEIISKYIKQFILAVILVNFSWFFPRVILDVANVLTATIYQLPSLAGTECKFDANAGKLDDKGNPKEPDYQDCKAILGYKFFQDAGECSTKKEIAAAGAAADEKKWVSPLGEVGGTHLVCVRYGLLKDTTDGPMKILNGLVVNHARLSEIPKVQNPGNKKDTFGDLITFLVTVILALVMHIGLFFPLIAMLVVFFLRIPILWITIAFMPFMFLGMVAGDKMGKFNSMDLIWRKFLSAAFLPAIVAIPFALGYIMINAAITSNPPAGGQLAALKLNAGPLLPTINNFWGLMWLFTAYIVIWAGVFMAMRIDEFYERMTSSIKQAGIGWGKVGMKLPFIAPIIPGPKGMTSPLAIGETAARPREALDKLRRSKFGDLRGKLTETPENAGGKIMASANYNLFKDKYKKIKIELDKGAGGKVTEAVNELKAEFRRNGFRDDKNFIMNVTSHLHSTDGGLTDDQKKGMHALLINNKVRTKL